MLLGYIPDFQIESLQSAMTEATYEAQTKNAVNRREDENPDPDINGLILDLNNSIDKDGDDGSGKDEYNFSDAEWDNFSSPPPKKYKGEGRMKREVKKGGTKGNKIWSE